MRLSRIQALLPFSTIALVFLVGILAQGAQAEDPPALVWESRHNHRPFSEDEAKAVTTDQAGNIYVTGSGYGYLGNPDFVTVKYDPTGIEVWKAHYGSLAYSYGDCYPLFPPVDNTPVDIGLDGAGNVYVTGTSGFGFYCPRPYGSSTIRFLHTVKYDPEGNRMWVIGSYGEAAAMVVHEDGTVYLTGSIVYYEYGSVSHSSYVTTRLDTFGNELWTATFEGPRDDDRAADIALDGLGNVYVTGRSEGTGTGYDYVTIKYDPDGNEAWVARFNGPTGLDDEAESIFVNTFGDVFVTGSSEGAGTGTDFTTIKYDPDGNVVWVARYNGLADSWDTAVSLVGDETGNAYVSGRSMGILTETDFLTIKYGSLGNVVWVSGYNGPVNGNDFPSSLTLTASGDVVVTGKSEGMDFAEDYATICYGASSGAELWTARYDGPANGEDAAASVARDDSGNVIVTGGSHGLQTGSDYATVKYDADGKDLWTARFENPGMGGSNDSPVAMALDPWGNICVTGVTSTPYRSESYDYATVKIDPEGRELWAVRYDGPAGSNDEPCDLAVDASGNIYVTGSSQGAGTWTDYLTIKYDPAGNELWTARYDGTGSEHDVPAAIAVDAGGNVCVTGRTIDTERGRNYLTIKYDPTGNELWTTQYDIGEASDLAVDVAGNVYVTGGSYRPETGTDFATIKYDPTGNELWVARYNSQGQFHESADALVLDDSGNVYVTGYGSNSSETTTIKYDGDGNELWVAKTFFLIPTALDVDALGNVYVTGGGWGATTTKYDADGNELWVAHYPPDNPQETVYSVAMQVDDTGAGYIAGGIFNFDYDSAFFLRSEYLMLKYDALGNLVWDLLYDGPSILDEGQDGAAALVLNDSGDLYVTGSSEFLGTSTDFATLRYTRDLTCNDPDGDGYGAPGSPECTYPERDCDNADPEVHPGDPEDDWEECHNGIDDDCDGFPDFDPFAGWNGFGGCRCDDTDGDGYGVPPDVGGCAYPGEDCDVTDPEVHPNAPELCDYKDNQCPGDPGYGEIDEGCALALVSPENGASLSNAPTFTWEAGLSDRFYLYLGIPVFGYGYLTFVVPTVEQNFTFPADIWQESITMRYWWSAWMVMGVDTTVDPPAWEASELRWFRKAK